MLTTQKEKTLLKLQKRMLENNQTTRTRETVYTNATPDGSAQTTEVVHSSSATGDSAVKINEIIWYFIGALNVVLVLRIIFLLLAARNSGFTSFLYNLTNPFVMPFQGIFPAPAGNGSYFDTAAVLAIIIYLLLAWGITALIKIMSTPKTNDQM